MTTTKLSRNEENVLRAFHRGDILSCQEIFKRWMSSSRYVAYGSIHRCLKRLEKRGMLAQVSRWRWSLTPVKKTKSVVKEVSAPDISDITGALHAAEKALAAGNKGSFKTYTNLPKDEKVEEIEPAMVTKVEQDFNWLQNMLYIGLTRLLVVTIVLLHHLITNAAIFS